MANVFVEVDKITISAEPQDVSSVSSDMPSIPNVNSSVRVLDVIVSTT